MRKRQPCLSNKKKQAAIEGIPEKEKRLKIVVKGYPLQVILPSDWGLTEYFPVKRQSLTVESLDTGEIFPSLKSASQRLGIAQSYLSTQAAAQRKKDPSLSYTIKVKGLSLKIEHKSEKVCLYSSFGDKILTAKKKAWRENLSIEENVRLVAKLINLSPYAVAISLNSYYIFPVSREVIERLFESKV